VYVKATKQGRFFSSLATLAAAMSPSRPGTSSPGAAGPLAAAPAVYLRQAHAVRTGWLRRSLRASSWEGLCAELINACAGGALLTAWALHLGATPLYTGLLVALPQIAQVFHLPAAWTTALVGHRRACLWLVGLSRQTLLPLAALPFLPVSDETRRGVLLAVAALAAVLGVLGNNAWVAWMAELVPRRIRGRYFGRRVGMNTMGGAVAAAAAGLLLDWARPRGQGALVLASLQVLACVLGLVAVWLMRRQHDPAPSEDAPPPSLAQTLEPLRDRRLRSLLCYHLAWNFAVGLAGSFFALHMLRNLHMGFALVAVHGAATAAFRMAAAPLWGACIDRVGARPVLAACSFGIGAIPFLWLLPSEGWLWPLALDAALAGLLWSGQSLAVFALPLSLTTRRQRPYYLASLSAMSGLAFTGATLVAGALATWLPARVSLAGASLHSLQLLFVASGVLRLAAAFITLRVREPRARDVGDLWEAITTGLRPAPQPGLVSGPSAPHGGQPIATAPQRSHLTGPLP
jgi:MFS family permease